MNKISFPDPDDTEGYVRSKIQQYYYLRSGKRKLQWMFKPYKGTTPHIREIFLGRCWDYVQNKHSFLFNSKNIDCVVLWNSFVKAFANKNPCGLRKRDYAEFFSMIYEKPLYDKVLLWSGTREWAHTYARLFDKYVTLEDTFAGFLLNGLTWCGSKNWPGINFNTCPYECSKQKAFWGLAADKLAMRARGIVHVMLNGTRQHLVDRQIFPAFMDDSYLAEDQVPKLPVGKITEVKLLVGHTLHHTKLEKCNSLSIKELQGRLVHRGLKTSCYDDPNVLRHLLCLNQPNDSLCLFRTMAENGD
ncbi:ADP-ribosyl cyclase/cyclic ADP-ribose hydrolase isoform X2 [Exaiptasia diaphana]|nr:ADP-ribosyl cyclase/cyclic ADP-ribose hydrolase isoform X2 [Exaiptasia diaphana]XP_028518722.1 ADP-ribosyl cyclase/cyclic ADP-ribose hydrolase isoform X2 [Exaiptasia diaphana]KXJ23028.1 ADP-ribosyl cyclase/cyclic ADP-ribose hydrolase [Exaiptasia diaphana]